MKIFLLVLLHLQEQHEKVFVYFFELGQPEMWMSLAHTHSCPFFICLHLRLKQMACGSWRTQAVLSKSCPSPSALSGISSWFYWSLKTSLELSFPSGDPNCSKTLPSLKVPDLLGSFVPLWRVWPGIISSEVHWEKPSSFLRGCRWGVVGTKATICPSITPLPTIFLSAVAFVGQDYVEGSPKRVS